jgi:hypothetical protein
VAAAVGLLVLAGCGRSDRAQVDVGMSVAPLDTQGTWVASVEESAMRPDKATTGRELLVPLVSGRDKLLVVLHGRARYLVDVLVHRPGNKYEIAGGCAKNVPLARDAHRRVEIRVDRHGDCTIAVRAA